MSRINNAVIEAGDSLSASDLNSRFTAFSQNNALNATNTRDAAFDLPQMQSTGFMGKHFAHADIGKSDFHHAAPVVVASYTGATYPTPHVVEDGTGTATVLSLGASGWALEANKDIMRVYWDLSVRATYSGTPWTGGGALGSFSIAGGTTVATSASCWVMWLEWDITSNALATWAPVTGQQSFNANFTGALYGAALSQVGATSVIPVWIQHVDGATDGVIGGGSLVNRELYWRGISGTYYALPGGNVTVYGLRLVVAGIAHPYHSGTTNYLAWDSTVGGAGQTLEYTSGGITAVHHTLG
jgi:hypothetical protein